MGIKGLIKFINGTFREEEWAHVDNLDWDHLVVDGNNVCYGLLDSIKGSGWLGGEYKKYGDSTKTLFQGLKRYFREVIVVFDGSRPELKMDTIFERKKSAMVKMHTMQQQKRWNSSARANPPLTMSVFLDVLRELDTKVIFVDGEADNATAALANRYRCPVLASDSDYFMFRLEHGFIQLDDWLRMNDKSRIFNLSMVKRHFELEEYDQWLLIPSMFGNDVIKPIDKPPHLRSFQNVLKALRNTTYQDFIEKLRNPTLRRNFFTAKESYKLPQPDKIGFLAVTDEKQLAALPKWVLKSLEEGKFLPYLLDAYSNKPCLSPKLIEFIAMESSWHISRSIRQHLYALMGLPEEAKIHEWIRIDYVPELKDEAVSPLQLDPPMCINDMEKYTEMERQGMVLKVLCHPSQHSHFLDKIEELEDKWKFPIAATFFWFQHVRTTSNLQKEHLLKSLLLSFLTCSGVIQNEIPAFAGSRPYMEMLHAFGQWQGVYYDARALNYLAREPFHTTSLALLYSGEVVMHYATVHARDPDWPARFIPESKLALFNKLYSVVVEPEHNMPRC
jgi:hypothetical protein